MVMATAYDDSKEKGTEQAPLEESGSKADQQRCHNRTVSGNSTMETDPGPPGKIREIA